MSLKIGDKLYGYNINYGWGLSAVSYEFTIKKETKTLWVLFLGDEECQRVRKSDLSIYGRRGVAVYKEKLDNLEKNVKEINEYKELRDLLVETIKSVDKYPLDQEQIKLLEILREFKK